MIKKKQTIKVYAKEVTAKNGTTFLAYNHVDANDKWYEVKFCLNTERPRSVGYWFVTVTEYFIKGNPPYNDILYVCGVESITSEQELAE